MDKSTTPIIIGMGKAGCYICLSPTFEASRLDETNELVSAREIIPFGITEKIPHHITAKADEKTFKMFVEFLNETAAKYRADYIFINLSKDVVRQPIWWHCTQYQLFIKGAPALLL